MCSNYETKTKKHCVCESIDQIEQLDNNYNNRNYIVVLLTTQSTTLPCQPVTN